MTLGTKIASGAVNIGDSLTKRNYTTIHLPWHYRKDRMMTVINAAALFEKRRNRRIPYSRYVFFATRKQFFEGELKDYSKYGLFIKSPVLLPVGEIITVALPYLEKTKEKRKGTVVWSNVEGFGVELFRDPAKRMTRKDFF